MSAEVSTAERRHRPLSAEQLERLREAIEPGATDVSARPLLGGVDTATYALRLERGGEARDVVVRVYRNWDGEQDAAAAVRRQHAVLGAVAAVTAAAPRPILADAAGDLIGEPLIVTSWLPGAPQAPTGRDDDAWAEQLATAMAALHATPLNGLPGDFPRHGTAAERLARFLARGADVRDPLWDKIGSALTPLAADVRANPPTLIHGDFWFGNTIWEDGRLTGIIDWDGAAIADPARDVAGARNDLALLSGARAADAFLARYERERGPLADLAFWDLLTSLPPTRWLPHWVEGYSDLGLELPLAEARARLEAWVENALERLER
ncbi:MAG TPA: phosphotransferase [Candidatus Limnocylindria bacterium]